MRFARRPRCAYIVTNRKRLAAARWQRRQRECLPLLGPLIAETQPSIDDVMDQRVQRWIVTEQANRDRRAVQWRTARCNIAARDPGVRQALLTYWKQENAISNDLLANLDLLKHHYGEWHVDADKVMFNDQATLAIYQGNLDRLKTDITTQQAAQAAVSQAPQ